MIKNNFRSFEWHGVVCFLHWEKAWQFRNLMLFNYICITELWCYSPLLSDFFPSYHPTVLSEYRRRINGGLQIKHWVKHYSDFFFNLISNFLTWIFWPTQIGNTEGLEDFPCCRSLKKRLQCRGDLKSIKMSIPTNISKQFNHCDFHLINQNMG